MSLSKSKCWYSNNRLHFLKCALPISLSRAQCYKTFLSVNCVFSYYARVFVRLCWKSLPGTNTLAYYKDSQITVVKSFITLAPSVCHSD